MYARFSIFSEEGFFLKCHEKSLSNCEISQKPSNKVLKIQTIVEEFQVNIELHHRIKNTSKLGLTISSEVYDLVISIPYCHKNQDNGIDSDVLMEYFCTSNIQKEDKVKDFMHSYRVAALNTVNRLIDFFENRFHDIPLETPVFKPLYFEEIWFDKEGSELYRNLTWWSSNGNLAYPPQYGEFKDNESSFGNDICSKIKMAIEDPYKESDIYEKIYSDSRESFFEGHFHRTIMSLAVACEVAIKTFYFSKSTPAGMAFQYLQEKQKVVVSPIELIHKIAKFVLGESFQDFDNDSYEHIDHLFRCRNKVVHQAVLSYTTKNGKEVKPDQEEIGKWLESANILFKWLNSKRS